MPEPSEMTLVEVIDQLVKYCDEHDIDCEEEGPKDRCPACLAEAAKEKL